MSCEKFEGATPLSSYLPLESKLLTHNFFRQNALQFGHEIKILAFHIFGLYNVSDIKSQGDGICVKSVTRFWNKKNSKVAQKIATAALTEKVTFFLKDKNHQIFGLLLWENLLPKLLKVAQTGHTFCVSRVIYKTVLIRFCALLLME